jgi:hypothetical protein
MVDLVEGEKDDILYEATPEDEASAKRLYYAGPVMGDRVTIAKDGFADVFDFLPEDFRKADLSGLPHRVEHEEGEDTIVGRIHNSVDEGGSKNVFGYVDLGTDDGREVAKKIVSGEMRELSLRHDNVIWEFPTGFVEAKMPREVSSTKKGLRGPSYRVTFAAYDSTLERRKR